MATEGQIMALANWLKVNVSEELQFEMASSALERLHEASEKYNEHKGANKGIVAATKRTIIKELRQAGYLIEDKDQEKVSEEPEFKTLESTIKEEEPAELAKYEQAIIDEVVVKLSACTVAAKELVDKDYQDLTLTDNGKSTLRHAVAATIFIQATRGGL